MYRQQIGVVHARLSYVVVVVVVVVYCVNTFIARHLSRVCAGDFVFRGRPVVVETGQSHQWRLQDAIVYVYATARARVCASVWIEDVYVYYVYTGTLGHGLKDYASELIIGQRELTSADTSFAPLRR